MKHVTLIGDSIRIGYQEIVRLESAGLGEIWTPEQNGLDSRNILEHLDDWVIARQPDLVHINCGLHDIKMEFGATAHQVPLDEYAANVSEILTRIQRETRAKIIWATTTPVHERWHHANKEFDRFEADVETYNQAATGIALELKIPVNDLNAIVTQAGRDLLLLPDGVHYKPEGYELLGKTVAEFVRRYL